MKKIQEILFLLNKNPSSSYVSQCLCFFKTSSPRLNYFVYILLSHFLCSLSLSLSSLYTTVHLDYGSFINHLLVTLIPSMLSITHPSPWYHCYHYQLPIFYTTQTAIDKRIKEGIQHNKIYTMTARQSTPTSDHSHSDNVRKRVCKACDRCRLKKSKVSNSN